MTKRISQVSVFGAVLLTFVAFAAYGQAQTKEVKKEPIGMTSATSGSEMFNSYCAPCRGNGT